jgi:hypothetical protein
MGGAAPHRRQKMQELKVLDKTMDFTLWLFEHTQKFPN